MRAITADLLEENLMQRSAILILSSGRRRPSSDVRDVSII
jgi:hypothetical protein